MVCPRYVSHWKHGTFQLPHPWHRFDSVCRKKYFRRAFKPSIHLLFWNQGKCLPSAVPNSFRKPGGSKGWNPAVFGAATGYGTEKPVCSADSRCQQLLWNTHRYRTSVGSGGKSIKVSRRRWQRHRILRYDRKRYPASLPVPAAGSGRNPHRASSVRWEKDPNQSPQLYRKPFYAIRKLPRIWIRNGSSSVGREKKK